MPNIVTFSQYHGKQTVWVPEADVEWWLRFWQRQGRPACRWRDYVAWGGYWPPTDSSDRVMLRRTKRNRTNYARWAGY